MKFKLKALSALEAFKSLTPALLPIFLSDILLVHIYSKAFGSHLFYLKLLGYVLAEAIVTWSVGHFADRWSRKKTLIVVHIATLAILLVSLLIPELLAFGLILSSISFSPNPVCRADLIDNYRSSLAVGKTNNFYRILGLTEVRLISISWLVQYSPWILYPLIIILNPLSFALILIVLVAFSFISSIFFFKDASDDAHRAQVKDLTTNFKRRPYTFIAFLCAQIVFFTTFDKIHSLENQPHLFFLVGIGAFVATLYCLSYRKTPHISHITGSYRMGLLLSFISYLSVFADAAVPVGFQVIAISAIGGSYLPYVYDIIAGRSRAERRSTMLAVAEITQLVASLFGVAISAALIGKNSLLFVITSVLFFLAIYSQSKEESY